jgi:hypothetical protein
MERALKGKEDVRTVLEEAQKRSLANQ